MEPREHKEQLSHDWVAVLARRDIRKRSLEIVSNSRWSLVGYLQARLQQD